MEGIGGCRREIFGQDGLQIFLCDPIPRLEDRKLGALFAHMLLTVDPNLKCVTNMVNRNCLPKNFRERHAAHVRRMFLNNVRRLRGHV